MLKSVATRLLGSSLLTRTAFLFNGHRLRILAYHGISEPAAFDHQMRFLAEEMTPVSSGQVLAALKGDDLPPRPVWVTFDDGAPSVVDAGLPILARYGISATAFVCPGVIDTQDPYWWQVAEAAEHLGLASGNEVARLKQVPDSVRRRRVEELRAAVENGHGPLAVRQMTTGEIWKWVEAGHSVGNHSWDHPLLDRCDPDEQRRQISLAHEWLVERIPNPPRLFAYPNGNHSPASESALHELSYDLAALFDHRLSGLGVPYRMSRLRVSTFRSAQAFRMTVSGAHSFALVGRRSSSAT